MNRSNFLKIGILSVACSLGPLALRAASPEPLSTPAKDLRSDTWTATDALGRALPGFDECGPRKGNRVVGMFYFVTHNNNGAKQGPFDVTKILAADPEHPQWGGGTHYWGEPEAGYYIMKDEWIIRRHARQLCDAGVDLIVLDNTNDHIYEDVFCFIADVFRRMRAEGEPTPQIACLPVRNRSNCSGTKFTAGAFTPTCGSDGKASRCCCSGSMSQGIASK